MPSSGAYRMTSKASFAAFLTQYRPESNLVSPMHTASWVTTIISMTHLLSILGLHVCKISFNPLCPDWQSLVLDPHISYEGLKIDYNDDLVLSDHLEDSKTSLFEYFDENYATHSPTPSTLPSTPVQALPVDGLPHLQRGIIERRSTLPTNWKSTSNSLQRILKLATQFSGGWADKVNFHISSSWHVTFFVFLVSILVILIHVTWIWFVSHRFCCHHWKDLLWWAGHHLSQTCQSSSQHYSNSYAC